MFSLTGKCLLDAYSTSGLFSTLETLASSCPGGASVGIGQAEDPKRKKNRARCTPHDSCQEAQHSQGMKSLIYYNEENVSGDQRERDQRGSGHNRGNTKAGVASMAWLLGRGLRK